MNILYLCQRVPFPPNRGDKIASYNAIRYLARRHSVFVAALADSEEEVENARALEALGVQTDIALHPPRAARLNALKALANGLPLSVAYYRSRDLMNKVRARAQETPMDVVVAFSSSMGQYAECAPGVPLVADFVDLDSQKWVLYSSSTGWPWSRIYALEGRRLLAYERELALRAARTLLVTETERRDCHRLIPEANAEVVSNGVDVDYFRPNGIEPVTRNIVFTGVMDYLPNVQAVLYFAREVFPRVRERVPDATFTIVGARPATRVLQLGGIEGIAITGQVPDVRPYLARGCVAVAPLLLARGIQNKILEAMAMERPVVATRAAFRGVDVAEGEGILVADKPKKFAERVARILDNAEFGRELGRRGRRAVEARYVWDYHLSKLESLLLEVTAGTRRSQDTGSLAPVRA